MIIKAIDLDEDLFEKVLDENMPLTESSLDDEDFIIEDDADDIKKTLDLALRVALKNKLREKL